MASKARNKYYLGHESIFNGTIKILVINLVLIARRGIAKVVYVNLLQLT